MNRDLQQIFKKQMESAYILERCKIITTKSFTAAAPDDNISHLLQKDSCKQLKRALDPWREIVVLARSLFIWEKPHFPAILAGIVTVFYFTIWYMDYSTLTTMSLIGIVLCLADYVVPKISLKIFDSAKWDGKQEKRYDAACEALCTIPSRICYLKDRLGREREDKPLMYVGVVVGLLLILAWLGNTFNNFFLAYLITLSVAMVPGVLHHKLVEKYCPALAAFFKKTE